MAKKKLVAMVEQDPEKPVEKKVLAQAIISISDSIRALRRSSGLNRKALEILVQHGTRCVGRTGTKPSLATVRAVLDSIEELRFKFT